MRYRVTHTTRYSYTDPVSVCHNEARLTPLDEARQQRHRSVITIEPPPSVLRERVDHFGNRVTYFNIESPHSELVVSVVSDIETGHALPQLAIDADTPWETVRDQFADGAEGDLLDWRQFLLESPLVPHLPGLAEYALASFTPGRGLTQAALDLTHRIHVDFSYVPGATDLSTPLAEVWSGRQGVCQDFAHIAIGMLRAIGLPASYVSGYLETLPPPGRPKLVGVDASHAWFALRHPDLGWLEFDPTNDQPPTEQYIVVARGRDYSDVTPLKGVVYGGGQHQLSVSVDVRNVSEHAANGTSSSEMRTTEHT